MPVPHTPPYQAREDARSYLMEMVTEGRKQQIAMKQQLQHKEKEDVETSKPMPRLPGRDGDICAQVFDLLSKGEMTKATRLLNSKGLADIEDSKVRESLEALYPNAPATPGISKDLINSVTTNGFESKEVLTYLTSRRRGTAGGHSGITYDILKSMVSTHKERALLAIANFCTAAELLQPPRLRTPQQQQLPNSITPPRVTVRGPCQGQGGPVKSQTHWHSGRLHQPHSRDDVKGPHQRA